MLWNRAGIKRAIWWTQAKLTSVFVAINGVAFGAIAFATPDTTRRLLLLVTIQIGLIAAYRSIARTLGAQHLNGQSRPTFEDRLWDAEWKPPFGTESWSKDEHAGFPKERQSFYRQLLGPSEEMSAALYGALACWEGISLTWPGATTPLAFALLSSAIGMALQQFKAPGLWLTATIFCGFLIPTFASALPEIGTLLFGKRLALRRGYLRRFAILAPRTREDLGMNWKHQMPEPAHWEMPEDSVRWIALAAIVGFGIPAVMVAIIADVVAILLQGLALVALVIVLCVAVNRSLTRFVVNTIPFVKFEGPIEVSILIDMNHRHRALMAFIALILVPLAALMQLKLDNLQLLFQTIGMPGVWAAQFIVSTWRGQFAGHPRLGSALAFERAFRRSVEKVQAAKP